MNSLQKIKNKLSLHTLKKFQTFKTLEEYQQYTNIKRPSMFVSLITADWNPLSKQAILDLESFSQQYPNMEYFVLSQCDDMRFNKLYDINATPTYVFHYQGQGLIQQCGVDRQQLQKSYQDLQELQENLQDYEYQFGYKEHQQDYIDRYYDKMRSNNPDRNFTQFNILYINK